MVLPNDVVLERKFLCLCVNIRRISHDVSHNDFYNPVYANMYRSFLYGEYEPTESSAKRNRFTLEQYYEVMTADQYSTVDFNRFARSMMDLSFRRKEIGSAQKLISNMTNMGKDVAVANYDKPRSMAELKEEILDISVNQKEIKFDSMYSLGFKVKTFDITQVLVLGGCSGTGKTNFGIQMAQDMCRANDEKWLFISLEMSAYAVYERMAKIEIYRNNPHIDFSESHEMFKKNKSKSAFYDMVNDDSMYLFDRAGQTIDQIEMTVKGQTEKDRAVRTVLIDYAQAISSNEDEYKTLNKVGDKVRLMAEKYDVRIILLTQLTKENYGSKSRPTGSAVKGSGKLYDCADELWFLYRDVQDAPEVLEVIHEKSRYNGINGQITYLTQNGLFISSQG